MEILFLGTSSGAPTKTRNVSAIALVESEGSDWYLIDCGEGTQHQLINTHLSLNNLSAIFLTHLHGDHCYGLPGLLASAGLNGRTTALRIVAPEGAREWIELTKRISDLHLPYDLQFILTDTKKTNTFGQFSVSVLSLSHRIASFGYVFSELNVKPSLNLEKLRTAGIPQGPLWGKIQSGHNVEYKGITYKADEYKEKNRKVRKIIICGDNDQPDLINAEAEQCDVLVHESTYTEEMADRAGSVGHSYASQIAAYAESAGIRNLVLTHVSARYTDGAIGILDEARKEFTGNIYLANDFDRFRFSPTLELKLIE